MGGTPSRKITLIGSIVPRASDGTAIDIAVADQIHGLNSACSWLQFGRAYWRCRGSRVPASSRTSKAPFLSSIREDAVPVQYSHATSGPLKVRKSSADAGTTLWSSAASRRMTSFHCNKRHEGLHMYDRTNIKKLPILGAKAPNERQSFHTFYQTV